MYTTRLRTLKKAYRNAERGNIAYQEAAVDIAKDKAQIQYIRGLGQS